MKKIYFLIISVAVVLIATASMAGIVSIDKWNGDIFATARVTNPRCAQECPEYSISTTICAEGKILESCPVEGCDHYYRCIDDTAVPID